MINRFIYTCIIISTLNIFLHSRINNFDPFYLHVLVLIIFMVIPITAIFIFEILRPINRLQIIINEKIKRITKSIILNKSGNDFEDILNSFTVLFDLNEKIQKQLCENERRIALMIDVLDIGVVEIDGNKDTIINTNKCFSNMIGISKEELLGIKIKDLEITEHDNEYNIINRNSRIGITTELKTENIPVNGHCNIVHSYLDISKRKEKEEELNKSKIRAENSTKSKTILLGNASHDIINLIAAIEGPVEKLQENKNLSSDDNMGLTRILAATSQMFQSVSLLRERTMLETGHSKVKNIPTNLKDLLTNLEETYKNKANDKNLEFIMNGPHLELTGEKINIGWVMLDESKLMAILGNLLGNAIKFTDEGLIMFTVNVLISNANDFRIKFKIDDTGIGIDDLSKENVFNMFEQSTLTTGGKFGGCGQGLSIADQYVQLMGGNIEMVSNLGDGSSFWFTISALKCLPPEELILTNDLIQTTRKFNILAAEDAEDLSEYAKNKFLKLGHSINMVSDGSQVMEELLNNYYDFVFLDIRMPVKDGIDTIKEIRNNQCHLPAIAMTANSSELDIEEYMKIGFDDCCGKPVKTIDLFNIINKYSHKIYVNEYEILEEYSEEEFIRMIDLFEYNYHIRIKEMMKLISNTSNNEIIDLQLEFMELAHKLKGSAAIVYFDAVRRICRVFETLCKQSSFDIDKVEKLLIILEKVVEYTMQQARGIFHKED